jgi:hypothetical protein
MVADLAAEEGLLEPDASSPVGAEVAGELERGDDGERSSGVVESEPAANGRRRPLSPDELRAALE